MAKTLSFTCELPNGVHARPASHMEQFCNKFASSINWTNTRTGATGDAKSVLSLIGTDTLLGDKCLITIDGLDEDEVLQQMQAFINGEFAKCDEALPQASHEDKDVAPLPRSLANLAPVTVRGNNVSTGIATGKLVSVNAFDFEKLENLPALRSMDEEKSSMASGLKALAHGIERQLQIAHGTESAILKAHLSIVSDTSFHQHLMNRVSEGSSCAEAIIATARHFSNQMKQSKSEYLRERELDIRDVSFQLLQQIYGAANFDNKLVLTEDSVCLAEDLTPSQFLELDKKHLKGLILSRGGSTSHTVILARSFKIPTLVGVEQTALNSAIGTQIVVDANLGLVATNLTDPVIRYYDQELNVQKTLEQQQGVFKNIQAQTEDGKRLEIAANIALPIEAKAAFNNGAESIGLFRTEMLYMDRQTAPDEDELYNIYCQAIEAAHGKAIIIRTMDIGGDKPVEYLNIPHENNPFLGYRAVRIYKEFFELFKSQLRSILRASAHGSLKIMIPMISSMEEILWVKELLSQVKHELRENKIPFDEKIPFGIMLEVPSIAFIIDQCCEEIDFFSIGSNDLTQYLIAVDRDNEKVANHYNSLNPAFLRTLDHIVREVHRHGKWVGLCGELGAKGSVLPLLVGLGLDEISMSAPNIPATKARLAKLDSKECRLLLNKAMACRTALEVEHLLAQFRMVQHDAPLLTSDCIILDSDLRSKEEVIKTMTDNLYLAGRCRYPNKLAEDLWAREDVFSTGLGFGFAIPHTKSEHIEQSTISVAKLANPIMWGDEEVRFIIMLTLNKHAAGDQHMKIFSRLARRIMHAGFRDGLFNSKSTFEIEQTLKTELEM